MSVIEKGFGSGQFLDPRSQPAHWILMVDCAEEMALGG